MCANVSFSHMESTDNHACKNIDNHAYASFERYKGDFRCVLKHIENTDNHT